MTEEELKKLKEDIKTNLEDIKSDIRKTTKIYNQQIIVGLIAMGIMLGVAIWLFILISKM